MSDHDTDARGEEYEAAKPLPTRSALIGDPFSRDPFDETPPVERDLKGWIAAYYRAQHGHLINERTAT